MAFLRNILIVALSENCKKKESVINQNHPLNHSTMSPPFKVQFETNSLFFKSALKKKWFVITLTSTF